MKKQRKHYTPDEKVAILRRHLLDKEPISKLCDGLGLQPTVFHEFFENGAAAFRAEASQPLRRAEAVSRPGGGGGRTVPKRFSRAALLENFPQSLCLKVVAAFPLAPPILRVPRT